MRTYDLTLQDRETSPVTTVSLLLAERKGADGKTFTPGVIERRAPPLIPGQRTGEVSYATLPPEDDFVFSQHDWSGGALVPTHTLDKPNCYSYSTFDASWPDVLMPGYGRNLGTNRGNDAAPIGVVIINPHFEAPEAKAKWATEGTPTTVTLAATAAPRTVLFGKQHARIVAAAANDGISFTVANPTIIRGNSITFAAYVKVVSGAGGVVVRITDSVGSTSSATITASSYTLATVTRAADAAATSIKFEIEATAANTFDADDCSAYMGTTSTPGKIVTMGGNKYTYFGRMVCQLRTSPVDEYVWDVVDVGPADATDIIAYKTNVYVAYGVAQAYRYGTGTTWTAAAGGAGVDRESRRWAVVRDELWKSEGVATIRKTTSDPETGAGWAAALTVGATDKVITELYDFQDVVWVAKEDGLWSYLRTYEDGTSANTFINQTNEFKNNISVDNFIAGAESDGSLWLPTATGGLIRVSPFKLDKVGSLFTAPAIDLAGRVHCVVPDATRTWFFVDDRLYFRTSDGVVHTATGPSLSLLTDAVEVVGVATSQGALNPATASGGSWATPTNVFSSNDAYATISDDDAWSSTYIQMLKGGAAHGTIDHFGVSNSQTDIVTTRGSSTDLRGGSWTPADINASNFGVQFRLLNSFGGDSGNLQATNFSFTIPTGATILGIEIAFEGKVNAAGTLYSLDHITLKIHYRDASTQTSGIYPRRAAIAWWGSKPHLLAHIQGVDTTNSVPYAVTDAWALPHQSQAPAVGDGVLPAALKVNVFKTSRWHGGLPSVDKAGVKLVVQFHRIDSTKAVVVKFGADGADPASVTLGTLSGSQDIQTLFFDDLGSPLTAATFKDIALQFEYTSSGTENNIHIHAFSLHSRLVRATVKEWLVEFFVGQGVLLNNGLPDTQSKAVVLSALETLEEQVYPIRMTEDFDGDDADTTTAVAIVPGSVSRVPEAFGDNPNIEIWRAIIREVKVA